MIDSHCHLEQKDYDEDRDEIIEKCKKELKALVTVCAHPSDFDLTLKLAEENKNFIFAEAGIHPEYIKEISEKEIEKFIEKIKENKNKIVGIGEVGLDYFWIKENDWQEKQKQLFIRFISLAKELKLPLTVHSRDAYEDVVKILEQEDAKKVHLHLFGDNTLVQRIADNGWYISIGPIVLKSKKHFQIARDMPIEKILLETDSPWNAPEVFLEGKKVRNDPTSIKIVAQKIAEIKKLDFNEVWKACGENAVRFFDLTL